MEKLCGQVLFRQLALFQKFPIVNVIVPQRGMALLKKRYRFKKYKRTVIDPKHFTFDKPISGSVEMAKEIEDLRSNKLFDFDVKSITNRGFLRFQKSYNPPPNVIETFLSICRAILPKGESLSESQLGNYKLDDSKLKYELLTAAFKEFNHSIPNSMLYLMNTTGDVIQFYNTPIETTTPYERLDKLPDLPPNIHIQKEPVRFHPDTDTKFGGVSAFPQSATIVTGIRAKKKFPGTQVEHRGYNYKVKF